MIESRLERIRRDIVSIAAFNATPGEGTTRLSYSPEDRQARDYLIAEMEAIGLDVTVDPVGNIRARLAGSESDRPAVMTGSHIDTVLNGGDFDGVAGVVAGLEMMRVFVENRLRPVHPVELIVFVEEEGPQFGFPLGGSRLLTGKFSPEVLKEQYDNAGRSMHECAEAFGLEPDRMGEAVLRPGEVGTMIELHIEQSVVLDELKLPVGIVDAVFGRQWIEVTFLGKSNHAGATPMKFRQDAMDGAARTIARIADLALEAGSETAVATVGRLVCEPNQPNVIPERVRFTVDIRDRDQDAIARIAQAITALAESVSQELNLECQVEKLSETPAIAFSTRVVETIEKAAEAAGIDHLRMQSGALHDACLMAGITDVGMIFVPSIGGRSHCPQENTRFEDLKTATDLLIGSVAELSGISIQPTE